jgi:hypothetical protein
MFREAVLKPSADAPSPSRQQQQQFKSPPPPATPPTVGEVGAAAELLRGIRQNSNNERKISRPLEIKKIPEAMEQAGHLPVKTKPAERTEVLDSVVFSEQQAAEQTETSEQSDSSSSRTVEPLRQQVETAEQQVETAEQQKGHPRPHLWVKVMGRHSPFCIMLYHTIVTTTCLLKYQREYQGRGFSVPGEIVAMKLCPI